MTDFTRARPPRSPLPPGAGGVLRVALQRALIAAAIAVALLAVSRLGAARADGDPASDVLIQQSLYLPQDAGLTAEQQARLAALLAEASRRGLPLRVAVIGSATDLGSVTALFGHPQSYARFLGLELSQVFHGPLLVVMPAGLGVDNLRLTGAASHELASVPPARSRGELGPVALTAVERLAAAAGHPLAVPRVSAPGGSGPSDAPAVAVFAIGAAIIVAAFAASFRARPPGLRRRATSG